jgi:hypothetical protein
LNEVSQLNGLKIGILTFHRCINYGSYWQAKCLADGLRSRGYNATILDHDSRRINLAEWKCAYQPLLPSATALADIPLYRNKIQRFFEAFESLPLSPRFLLDSPGEMEEYDLVIVGSDEVWNLFHPWYGGSPLFYGEGIQAERIISYAASFGNYCASLGLPEEWTNRLNKFDMISVRDENSRIIIRDALNIEPEVVLDPCLQFPIENEDRIFHHFQQPYIAVYGHRFSNNFIGEVRRWAAIKNLRLISIGYRNDWADEQWIDADPYEFSHFISGAEAVATNFFHGCVFSLRNAKPFVCEASDYRSFKIRNLLSKLRAEKHLITDETPFDLINACLTEPINSKIFETIDQYRQRSNDYLNRALEIQQLRVA